MYSQVVLKIWKPHSTRKNASNSINNGDMDVSPPSHNEIRVASQQLKDNKLLFKVQGNKLVGCIKKLIYGT